MAIGLEAASSVTALSGRTDQISRASATASPASPSAQPADGGAVRKAREDFTAMILQNFLEAAIPKNLTGGQDGPNAANSMYRSLLVEQLAKSVAASGQFNVFGDVADQRLVAPNASAPLTDRRADQSDKAPK